MELDDTDFNSPWDASLHRATEEVQVLPQGERQWDVLLSKFKKSKFKVSLATIKVMPARRSTRSGKRHAGKRTRRTTNRTRRPTGVSARPRRRWIATRFVTLAPFVTRLFVNGHRHFCNSGQRLLSCKVRSNEVV